MSVRILWKSALLCYTDRKWRRASPRRTCVAPLILGSSEQDRSLSLDSGRIRLCEALSGLTQPYAEVPLISTLMLIPAPILASILMLPPVPTPTLDPT